MMLAYTYFNENYYENPFEFDESRWESGKLKDSFSFLPFSAGGRHCIGQHLAIIEAKIFLSHVLMSYKLKLKDKPAPRMIFGLMYEFNDNKLVDLIKL